MLTGKTVLLGVTGGIAAYKIANLASMLHKAHANVHVLMTENATNFITPTTFESLTGNKCVVDTFDRNFQFNIQHVSLAKQADVAMIAPATANVIAKMAHGLADDMLTTTILACQCPKIVSPAMNTRMYENQVTQDNMKILEKYGFTVIKPACGYLACGDTGAGKMPEPEELMDYILQAVQCEKDLLGKKVLVTAGPTQEILDPVRYLTNHSTGKMGYAIAKAASRRGAEVTLVTGPSDLPAPRFMTVVPVTSAAEMFEAVSSRAAEQDIIVKSAAVADYTPANVASEKIKKKEGNLSIPLKRTTDILAWLGEHRRPGQFLCGFSMETENMLENSRSKLLRKKVDMIAANSLRTAGAGFAGDTNVLTLITADSEEILPLLSKEEAAHRLLDAILRRTAKAAETPSCQSDLPFRFGIIGAGFIAHKFCEAARMTGCEVAAVSSKNAERAADFAAKEQIPASFGSYEEMLDTVPLDAVYIATTHNFHYENIMLCLSKNLPVLCEKCMVCTRKEAEEIFAEAKKRNVFVMEAMWSRFLPHIRKAREWVQSGLIGNVEMATSVVAFCADYDPESRIFNPDLAGGAMWDVGVYATELLTYLLDEHPLEVKAMTSRAPTGTDKASTVLLRFSNCIGTVQTGVMTCTQEGITLSGTQGYIWIPTANVGHEAFLYNRKHELVEHFDQKFANGFVWETAEAVRCIREGLLESPVIPWKDTVNCAEIFDQTLTDLSK